MPPDNASIAPLIEAARQRHELTRAKAIRSLRELDHAGATVTFDAVARHATVSRSWLYNQPDLRAEIERLRETTRRAPLPAIPARQRASDASMQQRLHSANERNARLTEENQRLRRQLAHALGDQRATHTATPAPTQRRTRHASTTIGPC
jgi:hypothetical protein